MGERTKLIQNYKTAEAFTKTSCKKFKHDREKPYLGFNIPIDQGC